MENIIVARHGNYRAKTGELTPFGEQQINKLARFIEEFSQGSPRDSFYFATSPTPRARQSARILKSILGDREIKTWYELLCEEEESYKGQTEAIHKRVLGVEESNNIILVSHYAIGVDYPKYIMHQEGWDLGKEVVNVDKGKAIHLSLEKRTWRIIP